MTSKEALAQISEYSDAGITVRGTYYPPGKTVPEGDRKLFLAIESTNELSVQKAKVEITRLLKEVSLGKIYLDAKFRITFVCSTAVTIFLFLFSGTFENADKWNPSHQQGQIQSSLNIFLLTCIY